MQPEPNERLACLIHAEGPAGECIAGINRLAAKLAALGRVGKLIILGAGPELQCAGFATAEGQSVEFVPADLHYGEQLRRGFAKAGNADLVLRVPATGLEPDFLDTLFARARMGLVNPDLIVAARPVRSAGLWQGLLRSLHEWLLGWIFGLVVSDPTSPVQLIRRKVLRDSEPRAEGLFADYELAARANFIGHLLDELRLKSAWTGDPPPAPRWGQVWREAYRLLNHPDFPRRLPEGTAVAAGGGGAGPEQGERAKGKKRKKK